MVLRVLISPTTSCRSAFRSWAVVNPRAAQRASTAVMAATAGSRFSGSVVQEMQNSPLVPGFQLEASIACTRPAFSRISCQSTELSPLPSTIASRSSTGASSCARPGMGHASAARVSSTVSKRCSDRAASCSGSAGTSTGASRTRAGPPKCVATAARVAARSMSPTITTTRLLGTYRAR